MAWTSPRTFAANSTLTAADLNTFLRDNLNETSAAKAQNPGSIFVATGLNTIGERLADSQFISTSESTTSLSYVDLATIGPAVTVTTSVQALVFMNVNIRHSTGLAAWMSYAISGATSDPPQDNRALMLQNTLGQQLGCVILHTAITPGLNTFTAKYRVTTSGTTFAANRRLSVLPL